jgi:HTH-type transcriptional regulator / antitoxin HigA
MITNERQYRLSRAAAKRFRLALDQPEAPGLHPKAAKAMRDGIQSQLDQLDAELAAYDSLRKDTGRAFEADSILGIGEALVKVRIMRNLTQSELADRLSVAEQQVQRYEATRYRNVSAARLQEVADALNVAVREVFTLVEP